MGMFELSQKGAWPAKRIPRLMDLNWQKIVQSGKMWKIVYPYAQKQCVKYATNNKDGSEVDLSESLQYTRD